MSKSRKSAYFRHMFAYNFFWFIFFKLFQRSWNRREILRFWFLAYFKKTIFQGHNSTFSNFEAKRAKNGSQKPKIFFYKHVLEFIYATINWLVHQVVKIVIP